MKLLDRLLGIPPEKAAPDTFDYKMYRFGARTALAGLLVITAGIIADSMGSEIGIDTSFGGFMLLAIGGVALAGGVETLKQE